MIEDFQSTGYCISFMALASRRGQATLSGIRHIISPENVLNGLLRRFCVVIAGTLSLMILSGFNTHSETSDGWETVGSRVTYPKTSDGWETIKKNRPSDTESHATFAGKECTQDCSGHKAGYEWASEKGITNPDRCGGKSWSFIEGCRAYAATTADRGLPPIFLGAGAVLGLFVGQIVLLGPLFDKWAAHANAAEAANPGQAKRRAERLARRRGQSLT